MPEKLIIVHVWPGEPTHVAPAATIQAADKSLVALIAVRRAPGPGWRVAVHAAGSEPTIHDPPYARFADALEAAHADAYHHAHQLLEGVRP